MFYRTIPMCLIGFVLVNLVKTDPEITFAIQVKSENKTSVLFCDHTNDEQLKTYTVREGEEFKIITKYGSFINHLICKENKDDSRNFFHYISKGLKNMTTFRAEKRMGVVWKCEVLTHKNNPAILPQVQYKNEKYAMASCYMKIHVRLKSLPQTLLVNNMVVPAHRMNLSEPIDFLAEYQYMDGDVINVTCANFVKNAQLSMNFVMAGMMSDKSTMEDLSSQKRIGFVATLNYEHDNGFVICNRSEGTDYTTVMLTFAMRRDSRIVSIKINGMTIRPTLTKPENCYYTIDYKFTSDQLINVECEVHRTDMKLIVIDKWFRTAKEYIKSVVIQDQKVKMSFYLNPKDEKKLSCSADSLINNASAELVDIIFTAGNFFIDRYPLRMELPSNGTVMKLYNDIRKVIIYEFKEGESLELKCELNPFTFEGEVKYLHFNGSDDIKKDGSPVSKTFHVTGDHKNYKIVCYLKEQNRPQGRSANDNVLREIRVILREIVHITTTTTTTASSITAAGHLTPPGNSSPASIAPALSPEFGAPGSGLELPMTAVIASAVVCIIIICVSTVIVKLRKKNHSQSGPHLQNYENLATPSEASIPTYPPQWESNYAVPLDRRTEDTTYSVPVTEPALYSTPVPKNLRNKKQKAVDATYAVLEVPNARGRKNVFKETDDPNYSEVYANRKEPCYAKALPKSLRNKIEQDNNPYSYVTNEPPYVNTAEPEPMYCEPGKPPGGQYANLNNKHYANSTAHEYVEPTYCEPQK